MPTKCVRLRQNWAVMWPSSATSGTKIRVSTFKEGKIFLNVGDKFLLDANLGKGEGDKEKVGIDYKACRRTSCRAISYCSTMVACS